MYAISGSMHRPVDRKSPLPLPLPLPLPTPDASADDRPFCEGYFLEDLPRSRPTVRSSWCETFSQCLGIVSPVRSASATAHRQLLALLKRLPDTVPGNAELQAKIDGLQLAVGSFAMGRYAVGEQERELEKIIELTTAARRLEHQLTEDYCTRWQPMRAVRSRPFGPLAQGVRGTGTVAKPAATPADDLQNVPRQALLYASRT